MVQKPLYYGAISIHAAAPNPDSTLVATTGRGSGNLYLVNTATRRVMGKWQRCARGSPRCGHRRPGRSIRH